VNRILALQGLSASPITSTAYLAGSCDSNYCSSESAACSAQSVVCGNNTDLAW
jgi:hypothetical protein